MVEELVVGHEVSEVAAKSTELRQEARSGGKVMAAQGGLSEVHQERMYGLFVTEFWNKVVEQ